MYSVDGGVTRPVIPAVTPELEKSADRTVSWSCMHEFGGFAEELAMTQGSAFILTSKRNKLGQTKAFAVISWRKRASHLSDDFSTSFNA